MKLQIDSQLPDGVTLDLRIVLTTTPQLILNTGAISPPTHSLTMEVGGAGSTPPLFPDPTPEELAASAGAGGGGTATGGSTGFLSEAYCTFEDLRGGEQYPPAGFVEVNYAWPASPDMSDINAAIVAAIAQGQGTGANVVVLVPIGTYTGTMMIDVTGLDVHVVVAPAPGGNPLNTILDGAGSGPAVYVTGAALPTGQLTLGWTETNAVHLDPPVASSDYDSRGWHGFGITGGGANAALPEAAGSNVVMFDFSCDLPIGLRANRIHDNVTTSTNGGGVWVYQFPVTVGPTAGVEIVSNVIDNCRCLGPLSRSGGGIAAFRTGKLLVARNFIFENEAGRGGGVGINGATDWQMEVSLCDNFIYQNQALAGCGVWMQYGGDSSELTGYLEGNEIFDNYPPSGSIPRDGGGVLIQQSVAAPDGQYANWNLGIVRNHIYENGHNEITDERVRRGGGVCIQKALDEPDTIDFGDSLGPFGVLDPGAELLGQLFIGNAVFLNEAQNRAGGVYLAVSADPTQGNPFRFWSNTIWDNVVASSTGLGRGLYVQDGTGVGFEASSSIVHQHFEPPTLGNEADWFVGAGSTFPPLHYFFAPDCCATSPVCVTSVSGVEGWSAQLPELEMDSAQDVRRRGYCRQVLEVTAATPTVSPTIDAGVVPGGQTSNILPWLQSHPRLDGDLDADVRVSVRLDVGSDEAFRAVFRRGDANDDAVVDISVAVFMLAALFAFGSPSPRCTEAANANDDGAFNVADPVYLLASLFSSGPPPPAPYPTCGEDTTGPFLPCRESSCP